MLDIPRPALGWVGLVSAGELLKVTFRSQPYVFHRGYAENCLAWQCRSCGTKLKQVNFSSNAGEIAMERKLDQLKQQALVVTVLSTATLCLSLLRHDHSDR